MVIASSLCHELIETQWLHEHKSPLSSGLQPTSIMMKVYPSARVRKTELTMFSTWEYQNITD